MKLLEILGKPEASEEAQGDYTSRLRDLRIKRVGSGIQADVYQHPQVDTIVVKVASEHDAPLAYLQYVLKHQDNPYVPKVYNVRRFQRGESISRSSYYVAFIEKLAEYKRLGSAKKRAVLTKHLGPNVMEYLEQTTYSVTVSAFEYLATPKGIQAMRASNKKQGIPHKHLIDVLSYVYKLGERGRADLHDGNIMLRGDVPVITDPVV